MPCFLLSRADAWNQRTASRKGRATYAINVFYGTALSRRSRRRGGAFFGLPNKFFNHEKGAQLYQEYLDEAVYAEEMGFDAVMLNERRRAFSSRRSTQHSATTQEKLVMLGVDFVEPRGELSRKCNAQ